MVGGGKEEVGTACIWPWLIVGLKQTVRREFNKSRGTLPIVCGVNALLLRMKCPQLANSEPCPERCAFLDSVFPHPPSIVQFLECFILVTCLVS